MQHHRGHLGGLFGGDCGSGELLVIAGTAGASWRSVGASSFVIVARRIAFFNRLPILPVGPL